MAVQVSIWTPSVGCQRVCGFAKQGFPIPMRGNETPDSDVVEITGAKFPIPMRGNERIGHRYAYACTFAFPIPMRGNEQSRPVIHSSP